MTPGLRKTLYDYIIELLLVEPWSVLHIQESLEDKGVLVTLQGIYKALRELIAEDIVVKQKQIYSINNVWREKTGNLFVKRSRFKLSPGEQVTYRFRKLEHLDAFWKHTLSDIEREFDGFPIFHFTPHQFWPLVPGRKGSEEEYYADLAKRNTNIYTIIGGALPIDKITQKNIRADHHQVFLDPEINFSRRDHLSVIGDYIILTRVSGSLAKQVDKIYETVNDERVLEKNLERVFKGNTSIVMMVENNRTKAKRLRKKLSADFHVPMELREKFDLF